MKSIWRYLYLAAGTVELLNRSGLIDIDEAWIKPTLMPILFFGVLSEFIKSKNKVLSFLLIGIFFSWWGDIFLLGSESSHFLLGLSSFLIAQLIYAFMFNKAKWDQSVLKKGKWFPQFRMVLVGLLLVMMYFQWPQLGDMKVPVLLYSLAITGMAISAASREGFASNKSFWYCAIGAFVFVISDSLIAVQQFGSPFKGGSFLVMLTYIVAQYLIVEGVLMWAKEKKSS